jgi:hypothetical protein
MKGTLDPVCVCVSSGFGDRKEQMGQNCYSVLACNKIMTVKFH